MRQRLGPGDGRAGALYRTYDRHRAFPSPSDARGGGHGGLWVQCVGQIYGWERLWAPVVLLAGSGVWAFSHASRKRRAHHERPGAELHVLIFCGKECAEISLPLCSKRLGLKFAHFFRSAQN